MISDERSYNFSGQTLLKYILRPLASCPSLDAVVESQPHIIVIRFESVMTDLEHPSPSEVFAKIRLVLEVFQKHLLGMCPHGSALTFLCLGKVSIGFKSKYYFKGDKHVPRWMCRGLEVSKLCHRSKVITFLFPALLYGCVPRHMECRVTRGTPDSVLVSSTV